MRTHDCRRALGWLVLLAPLFAHAQAHPDAVTPATWVGVDTADGRPSSVRLALQPASDTAQVVFGEPRNCRLDARLSDQGDGQLHYDLVGANGGRWCNRLYPGRMQVQVRDGQATLQLHGDGAAAEVPLWASGQVPVEAGLPAALSGRWVTRVQSAANVPVGLQLALAGSEPGDLGSSLAYASPRNCRVPLRLEGRTAEGAWYSVRPGNGGAACDRLVGRWIVLQTIDDTARLRIEPAIGECAPGCVLQRATP